MFVCSGFVRNQRSKSILSFSLTCFLPGYHKMSLPTAFGRLIVIMIPAAISKIRIEGSKCGHANASESGGRLQVARYCAYPKDL